VVDPGVGSSRRLLVVGLHATQACLVGPDNGVFSYLLDDARSLEAYEIDLAAFPGAAATFHGRDVLGPVAGRIAGGVEASGFGRAVVDPVRLPPYREPAGVREGRVLHIDRFGNVITTLQPFGRQGEIVVGGRRIRRHARCYADLDEAEAGWYVGSLGLVEVAVRDGSAARRLGVGLDAPVQVVE
jgi:S-adenosylmethionine hydrolase